MKNHLPRLSFRSFTYYWRDYLYQLLIIILLGAIITGSFFTGESVKSSLKKNTRQKLGNTGIMISSGLRFFNPAISGKFKKLTGFDNVPILETDGYCQNFSTGSAALDCNIYGITNDFFGFQGLSNIKIEPGTVAINSKMAEHLGISSGDEIIIRFREADPVPANAPFAPKEGQEGSKVMKVSMILDPDQAGNFSLGINQLIPMNVFFRIEDLQDKNDGRLKVNRLLISNSSRINADSVNKALQEILVLSDIGYEFRHSDVTGEIELISDRIFIDSAMVKSIRNRLPEGRPVITYLANTIRSDKSETPYSFISGIETMEQELNSREVLISSWLSSDLKVNEGDSIYMNWYVPEGRLLSEKGEKFAVKGIFSDDSPLADPSLMPEFPGISGRTSCSSWDAGIPILMSRIRDKDEEYWNEYKGTPKVILGYETGMKLWGNQFGNATAIRFPGSYSPEKILASLYGYIKPSDAGFTVSDILSAGDDAASGSVDFSELFLSLGFFVLVSCIILLSFSVSMFFDSRKEHILTYHSLGFTGKRIRLIIFSEMFFIQLVGTITGAFSGYGINLLIVRALNTIWEGAVQTNSITPDFGYMPLIKGMVLTIVTALIAGSVKLNSYLKRLYISVKEPGIKRRGRSSLFLAAVIIPCALVLSGITIFKSDSGIILSFISGILVFISFILLIRFYYKTAPSKEGLRKNYSRRYYLSETSQIIAPVIFIAAGIFAIMITSANKLNLNDDALKNYGGTGGYKLWAETTIPVRIDLNSDEGIKEFGLNDITINEIIQAYRLKGDDASCLNLNHVKAPPVLGLDPHNFIERGSFSFAEVSAIAENRDPWEMLTIEPGKNTVYGIADQTVLQWGLMLNPGDTIVLRSESGEPLNIILCAGLRSSVFQGNLIIGESIFRKYFPSVSGSSVFLVDCDTSLVTSVKELMTERFSQYGMSTENAGDKLASFFVVTNTYLEVFSVLGIMGLILGVAGLGFMLLRNFEKRKREFAFLAAIGFTTGKIKKLVIKDQFIVLLSGLITGLTSSVIATIPSLRSSGAVSWLPIITMSILVLITGTIILMVSVKRITRENLLQQLKKD